MTNRVKAAVDYIRRQTALKPRAGLILGSGLGGFADTLNNKIKIPTAQIPHYPQSTVEGHQGNLVFGYHGSTPLLAVQGRTHFYEGYSMGDITFVIRIMQALGIDHLLVTNAAGGLNRQFSPGDLMLITDQVNFLFGNPLRGPLEYGPPRFPDMSAAFCKAYFPLVEQVATQHNITLRRGVLWANSGPTFETPAEVRMMEKFGADAASMSTVPEVIVAAQAGMKCLGISCITNMAAGFSSQKLSHEEVQEMAGQTREQFTTLVTGIIETIFAPLSIA